MDSLDTLLYEEQDNVAIVTLNRPEVHNAFNLAMQHELRHVWTSLRRNDDVRAVVLTGAGEKAFCTGIDRQESIQEGYLDKKKVAESSGRVSTPYMFNDPGDNINPKQNDLWKPVVAAVNGMACGGALYMLGEADIILAAEHATFFDPHVTYGMVAGFESMHLLQKLPMGETLRLVLLGAHERMSATRAHQMGLVSEVTPADELLERAMWVARAIASAPPLAIQGTLRAVWMAQEQSRRNALSQMSTIVSLGSVQENIDSGQQTFKERGRSGGCGEVSPPSALLIDIDGVLVVSWEALPGTREAFAALREAKVPLRLLTNTTSRTRAGITESLHRAGFDVAPDEVLTAAAATASHLTAHRPGARCLLLNSGDDITEDLPGVTLVGPGTVNEDVDVVIVGGAGPEFSYETLNRAFACLLDGAALLAMHRNLVWRTSRGLQLDAGAYLAALELAAGLEATVIGKPSAAMFDAALTSLGLDPSETAMIGDDLDSDVRGAQALGIGGVQVRTGKFRPEQLDRGDAPDFIIESFADVPHWMGLS